MEDIQRVVGELSEENDRRAAADPITKKSLSIVEEFLHKHPVMCYGGTAINNLLPKQDRFYDPAVDVPDYDFFSKTPIEHATVLANKLARAGIHNVEVKPGVHAGTFKVFANFVGVADITLIDEAIFDRLWKENYVKDGIHYVSPNFLRMSMYLELSRPRGDVSRWEKVYKRLELLNKHYPVMCTKKEAREHEEITPEQKKNIMTMLKKEPLILLGATAAEIHLHEKWTTPIMLLGDAETINRLTEGMDTKVLPETEVLPERIQVLSKTGTQFFQFYKTTACHSYHTLPSGIRVASIPTVLQFVFAYTYTDAKPDNIAGFLCIAQKLVELAAHKKERRFDLLTPKDCVGTQETLTDMRREKSEMYEKLAKDKSSQKFKELFYTYVPGKN